MAGRRWATVAAAVVAALVLAACGSDVAANDVEVGQCTNEDLTGSVGDIDSVDCAQSHIAEVYAVFDIDGDEFPGTDEVGNEAAQGCNGQRFEDYVGVPFESSEVFTTFLAPNEETWNDADDRTVICFAVTQDGSPSEGSVEGIDR